MDTVRAMVAKTSGRGGSRSHHSPGFFCLWFFDVLCDLCGGRIEKAIDLRWFHRHLCDKISMWTLDFFVCSFEFPPRCAFSLQFLYHFSIDVEIFKLQQVQVQVPSRRTLQRMVSRMTNMRVRQAKRVGSMKMAILRGKKLTRRWKSKTCHETFAKVK